MAQCSECNKKLGFFESKKRFSDGTYMCASCLEEFKIKNKKMIPELKKLVNSIKKK